MEEHKQNLLVCSFFDYSLASQTCLLFFQPVYCSLCGHLRLFTAVYYCVE